MKIFLWALFCPLFFWNLSAQTPLKISEGKVKFKIEYLSYSQELKENEELKKLLPGEFTFFFKGRKSRTEIENTEMGKMVLLGDAAIGDVTTLIDLPDAKIALEQSGKDLQAENAELLKTMTVTETGETRLIAGYTCKKAVVKFKEGETERTATVFYTPELPAANNEDFPQINGFLTEYEEEDEEGTRTRITALEIKEEKVADLQFSVPEGYRKVAEEDFMELIGK